jgi:hypothetical protein
LLFSYLQGVLHQSLAALPVLLFSSPWQLTLKVFVIRDPDIIIIKPKQSLHAGLASDIVKALKNVTQTLRGMTTSPACW